MWQLAVASNYLGESLKLETPKTEKPQQETWIAISIVAGQKQDKISDWSRRVLQVIAKLLEDGHVTLSVDSQQVSGTSTGISNVMNADSNIYIGESATLRRPFRSIIYISIMHEKVAFL